MANIEWEKQKEKKRMITLWRLGCINDVFAALEGAMYMK